MNCLDILVNVTLLVVLHVILRKGEKLKHSGVLSVLGNIIRIFHYPLILFLLIYIIAHKDNILMLYLGVDFCFYVVKISTFSKVFCLLWCVFNTIQIILESSLSKNDDINKNDRLYALKLLINILQIIVIAMLVFILLVVFDLKPLSLFLTIAPPLTLLSLLLKNTIEDFLLGLYIMLSGIYKKGDHIYITDKNLDGYISNIGLKLIEIKTLDNNVVFLRNIFFLSSLVIKKNDLCKINIGFSVNIEYVKLIDANETIRIIHEHIRAYGNNCCVVFKIREINHNLVCFDVILSLEFEEKDKDKVVNKEIEHIDKIIEIINNNGGEVKNVYNFTK